MASDLLTRERLAVAAEEWNAYDFRGARPHGDAWDCSSPDDIERTMMFQESDSEGNHGHFSVSFVPGTAEVRRTMAIIDGMDLGGQAGPVSSRGPGM